MLDVGCGTGGFCALAAERGAVVHGIDAMPERVAEARRRVPGGYFRVELMEQLPWPAGSFDVVTGFNSFQYALDVELALTEACRVGKGGRVAVCKYGRPADNDFFAFLGTLEPDRLCLEGLPEKDPVARAIERLGLDVVVAGEAPAVMALADEHALTAALKSAGARLGSPAHLAAAAAPYRQADGSYRFENRLRYQVVQRAV